MSDLQFNITAKDQASRVVTEVQKKVTEFGKDIGRSILAVAGPMALITMAFSKISEHMADMKQKAKEAFDWGSGLSASAGRLGVTVEEFQRLNDIAERTGEPIDRVVKAFKEAGRVLAEARTGNKEAAASLEALGFSLADLEKLKPEDVVKALGDALATIENPTDKATAAFAAFGEEGKKLIDTLEKIRNLANAPKSNVLSDEEARFLSVYAQQEKDAAERERLRLAREDATRKFLETPEGRKIVQRESSMLPSSSTYAPVAPNIANVTDLSKQKRIQDEVQAALAARFKAEDEKNKPTAKDEATGRTLVGLGKARQEKPAEKPKPEINKVERPEITVSSLRSIGGGMAGEVATGADLARTQVELQRNANKLLEDIKARLPGAPVDQTKYGNTGDPGAMGPVSAGQLVANT